MPEVNRRIDDIQYANYSIPVLQHGNRVLVARDRVASTAFEYEHSETDYVDALEEKTYTLPDVEFNATLNGDELLQLNKLNELLRKLVSDKNVTDQQLKRALTEQQYADYKESLTAVVHSNEIKYADGMPAELRGYQALLKAADFEYNKFEKMSARARYGRARYRPDTVRRGYEKAEALYEHALERLEEIYSSCDGYQRYQLQLWMDRELDFDAGIERKIGIDAETIPRVRGSKSSNALDSGLPKLSKRLKRKECQLLALRDAAWTLAFEEQVVADDAPVVRSERLNKLLQLRDDDI